MAGLPPDVFAARLGAISKQLQGMARVASEGLIDGLEAIAEKAVGRLVERTPRSEHADIFLEAAIGSGAHIADGWTARRVDLGAGIFAIDIINADPRATANLHLADGTELPYTLLDVLEYGSAPHEIRPVNAKHLRFTTKGGDDVRTNVVHHPGTQPYAMVATTEAEVSVDVKKLIDATRRTLALRRAG